MTCDTARRRWMVASACCAAALVARAADNPATAIEHPAIEVIGVTPVPGLGMPLREVPSAVQSFGAESLRRRDSLDAAEHMERHFAGVSANAAQSNPFQPDLQFRGYAASHLLGLPQGLSVFVDGVRANEAFGDVVNWDLIPRNAISSAHLLSGANPVFGLNTLGGALSIFTKSGFAFPGASARLVSGAFGRRAAEFESGGHGASTDWFLAGHALDERGWRQHSASALRQLFAKTGWQDARSDVDASLSVADNALQGTQTLPRSMLGAPREAYTWPDRTRNALGFATLRGSRYLRDDLLVAALAYRRELRQSNLSSNVNEDYDPALPAGSGNTPATNDRHELRQRMQGLSLQATFDGRIHGRRHQLTIGASLDRAESDFSQQRQEALVSPDRGADGFGNFVPGTRVRTVNSTLGLYVSGHYALNAEWMLAAFGRYNLARVRIADRSGMQPALDGRHEFRRFNPGIGMNYNPSPRLGWFASAGQGMRVPSPMELTCADPSAPCTLPNQFLADPPLKPVIARTLEAGLRARPGDAVQFAAAAYRTLLSDDIQFVSSGGLLNAGYFQNVGRTLRAGLEATASAAFEDFRLEAGYGAVRATYLTGFSMHSPNNSAADAGGNIAVSRGDRLPAIARRQLKILADWQVGARTSLGFGWNWFDRQYVRGDENNRDANGAIPAYGVAFATARHALAPGWELALKVDNLFNARHESFGVLGRNYFAGPGARFDPASAVAEQFRSPGAPRAIWVSLRYEQKAEAAR